MGRSKKEESLVELENELDTVENEEESTEEKLVEEPVAEVVAQEEEPKPKRRRQRRQKKAPELSLDSFTATEVEGDVLTNTEIPAPQNGDQTAALLKSIDGMTKQWQITLQTLIQDPRRTEKTEVRPPAINKIAMGLSIFSFLLSLISLSLSQSARQTAIHNDLAVHDRISQVESSLNYQRPQIPMKRKR